MIPTYTRLQPSLKLLREPAILMEKAEDNYDGFPSLHSSLELILAAPLHGKCHYSTAIKLRYNGNRLGVQILLLIEKGKKKKGIVMLI